MLPLMMPAGPLLGAIEIVELGRPRQRILGQVVSETVGGGGTSGFFGDILGTGLKTIADVVNAPLSALSQGLGTIFETIAGVLRGIPILGDIVAAILLVANAAIQFVLAIPGFVLGQLSNVFGGLMGSFGKAFSPGEQAAKLFGAKNDLIDRAPASSKDDVRSKLDAKPVQPQAPPAPTQGIGGDVGTLIAVGAAAGIAAAVFL